MSFTSFTEKHASYFSVLWNISMSLGFIWGFWKWIEALFLNAQHGSIFGFFIAFIFQTLLIGWYGITTAIVLFIALLLISFFPYLIIRGLTK